MDLQDFRNKLRSHLQERKITLSALSVMADLSEDTLRSVIYGKSQDIRLSTIVKIADVLNFTIDELIDRNFYPKEIQDITNRLCQLPPRSIKSIHFMLDLEEHLVLKNSQHGTMKIPIILPNGNEKDGMFYDTCQFEYMDISEIPQTIQNTIDIGLKITTGNFAPVYFPKDVLLLSTQKMPVLHDIVLYCDQDGRLYLRKNTETGLMPVNGIGKYIPATETIHYHVLGIVIRTVREFDIEDYR